VNKQAAQHRTLTAQLQASDDRWLEGQEQIKKLQNELADAEQELSNVQRKLFTMRSSSDLAAKEAAAAATLQPPSTPAAVAMGTPGPGAASTPCPAAAAQVSHALAR
jgi:E3 ubiquitin-protein ligase BRE1